MIAREIIINPWVFKGKTEVSERERINILIEHLNLLQKHGETRNHLILKKNILRHI